MITVEKVEKEYEGLIHEMQFLAGDCLLHEGALSGLQKALSQEKYLDNHYIRDKINSIRKTLDGLEHDLAIAERIEKGKF